MPVTHERRSEKTRSLTSVKQLSRWKAALEKCLHEPEDDSETPRGLCREAITLGISNEDDLWTASGDWNQKRETPLSKRRLFEIFRDVKLEQDPSSTPFESGSEVEVAQRVIDRLGGKGQVVAVGGRVHRYESSGVWRAMPDPEVRKIAQTFDGHPVLRTDGSLGGLKVSAKFAKSILDTIQSELDDAAFFFNAPAGIAFRNGFVTCSGEGIALKPHDPSNRVLSAYDFDYEPTRTMERSMRFLRDLFEGDGDQQEKIDLVQEYTGLCLIGKATQFPHCLFCVGNGANGKSRAIELMSMLFTAESLRAIPPQNWGQAYFVADLAGIRFNAVAEMPPSRIVASDKFKSVISGDPMIGRVPYGRPLTVVPIAGHVFSMNPPLPEVADVSDGFWRRVVVLRFNRKFEPGQPGYEPQEGLMTAIEVERPGLMAWALEGAVRVLRTGRVTIPPSSEEEKSAWRQTADHVSVFVREFFEELDYGEGRQWFDLKNQTYLEPCWWNASIVYGHFRAWCQRCGFPPIDLNDFGTRIRALGVPVKKANGRRVYGLHAKQSTSWGPPEPIALDGLTEEG